MRMSACSRDSAIIAVYSLISPPTTALKAACISFPTCRARMVFPMTVPKCSFILWPETFSVVVMITV